ncbi:acyltransferase family protein [Sedimenticola selenatireducens]|nr:acyltransferase family protein [Sedimenticola selenatireducens]
MNANYSNYRPDIDGLRAVAVLSVILFHLNESLLPGGFVGVDIFFVISGYLISLHILRDLSKGTFSLLEFYRRRVKRILPAMLVVVFVTIVIAQFLIRPSDAERVAESGLWSLLSMANVYFWLFEDSSYFAPNSNQIPLLHLWSLGVEEQFYIFWPLVLGVAYRWGHGKNFFLVFSIVAAFSYLAAEYLFRFDPSFVYYMLPTRAGELLIGALLALYIIKRGDISLPNVFPMIAAYTGTFLIAGSITLLSEDIVFPGLHAIPPTLGATMLIFAGHYRVTLPIRALRLQPLVWVGLISYSAYLWHWPLLAFYRYGANEPGLYSGTALFVLTLVLAWLNYKYIETPMRRSNRSAIAIIVRYFIIPTGAIAFIALVSMKLDGFGLRWFSPEYRTALMAIREEVKPAYQFDYVCQSQRVTKVDITNPGCVLGEAEQTEPAVLLWGDSNAAHYVGILGAVAKHQGFRFRNLQLGSCPPILEGIAAATNTKRIADCEHAISLISETLGSYKVIMISANWTGYAEKSPDFYQHLADTVEYITASGSHVILIGKAPILHGYDRLCREKALSYPIGSCRVEPVELAPEILNANQRLSAMATENELVEYIDFNSTLCEGVCSAYDRNDKLLYYDSGHLSLPGSWSVGRELVDSNAIPQPLASIPAYVKEPHQPR